MTDTFSTISPFDSSSVSTHSFCTEEQIKEAVNKGQAAFDSWRFSTLEERVNILLKFCDKLTEHAQLLAEDLTKYMGRPKRFSKGEINTTILRIKSLIKHVDRLNDEVVLDNKEQKLIIRKEALGIVFVIAPWNYPYLTSINSIAAALLTGNCVILKHSPQTPVCSEHYFNLLKESGLPQNVFQYLHLKPELTKHVINNEIVQFVQFTGSVENGYLVKQLCDKRMIKSAFELGGKDAAYIMEDIEDIKYVAEQVADGIIFNSGQSCCSIERVYVHENIYDKFVKELKMFIEESVVLGNPSDTETTLGPLINERSAKFARTQIEDAVKNGARKLITKEYKFDGIDNFVSPQILLNCKEEISAHKEESFSPIAVLNKVKDNDEAIALINNSKFGLTSSIWTKDHEYATKNIVPKINTGTVFINNSDNLHPELPWVGIKESGVGFGLSKYCLDNFVRYKSINIKKL